MALDAVIISEPGRGGSTGIVPGSLSINGRPCSIQTILNCLKHGGHVKEPVDGDGKLSWWSAPKLNGLYLLSYLTGKGFRVGLVNQYFRERDHFLGLIAEKPSAIVISTTFIRNRQALGELVSDIRLHAPDVPIISGGSFVYLSYRVLQRSHEPGYLPPSARDDLLFFNSDDAEVDLHIISLVGEPILVEALERLRAGRSLEGLPNTGQYTDGAYSFSERVDDIPEELDFSVDWKSLPERVFRSGVMPLQTSKGCPYRCAFCNFTRDPRLMCVKPLDHLIRELADLSERGIRYVWFSDDNFRLGSRNLNEVCRAIIDADLGLQWLTMLRADTLKHVDMDLLKKAGCVEVQVGLESADPQILENMNKKADAKTYRQAVKSVLEAGINCSAFFIFGFPGETDASAMRTREFIQSIQYPELEGTLSWSLFPFSLYAMSPVFEVKVRQHYGLSGYLRNWRHRTMDSDRAMMHVREAFWELDDSCPVYRGDNLAVLYTMGPAERKRFLVGRHRISKLALLGKWGDAEIAEAFRTQIPHLATLAESGRMRPKEQAAHTGG